MKWIGLLGGMSWESSIEYERMINIAVRERLGGAHSADVVIRSFDFAEIENPSVDRRLGRRDRGRRPAGGPVHTVGLLGTRYTMEQAFYCERLAERHGLDVRVPPESDRTMVHEVIYGESVGPGLVGTRNSTCQSRGFIRHPLWNHKTCPRQGVG
jgi:aspartate racemase